jgi:acetyl-CoA carboxylase carboxyl transferase subunit alpha
MLQYSYYSVISTEGCAGILWKCHEFAERAATALRFTSSHLSQFGIVDDVIEEPLGGAHRDVRQMANRMKVYLSRTLRELVSRPTEQLLDERYQKFRRIGVYLEGAVAAPKPAQSRSKAALVSR